MVHNIGESVTDVDSSSSRMGFVIAQSDTAESAIAVCEKALDEIHVVIE